MRIQKNRERWRKSEIREREGKRERGRERESFESMDIGTRKKQLPRAMLRDRHTDRQTDRQIDRDRSRDTDTDRQIKRQR